ILTDFLCLVVARSNAPPTGRIQVFVRVRPFGPQDVKCSQFGREAVQVGNAEMTQLNVSEGKTEKIFEFDQVIPPETGNEEVYKIIGKPLVEACLTGMNGILMAYGQTGAGKTYTLMASDGVTPSIVNTVFSIIERDQTHSYTVTCSYLQIYQERIYDLLCAGKMREVFLREHPKKGVFVDHLSELLVRTPNDVTALFATGRKRLVFAETKMNRHSSRSHAICQLKIERIDMPTRYGVYDAHAYTMTSDSFGDLTFSGLSSPITGYHSDGSTSSEIPPYFDYEEDDDVYSKVHTLTKGASTVRGRIFICDLAGSERIKKTKAQGERLQEAQAINSSLLELGNVIHALAEAKTNHVPYRNSILTRFLQDGLSGNSKTYLVVCVSPSLSDVNETLCSLKFGLRAMKVESTAQVNIEFMPDFAAGYSALPRRNTEEQLSLHVVRKGGFSDCTVDYEKMARQLAETLENKEQEWRRLRSEYESYIMSLKSSQKFTEPQFDLYSSEQGLPGKTLSGSWQKDTVSPIEESLKNQTKALLLVELISMELFYGMEDLLRDGGTTLGKEVPTEKLYALTDRDLLLHSAETLLELTEYFFTKSIPSSASNAMVNGHDRIEDIIPPIGVDVSSKRKLHEYLREYVQRRIGPTREEPGVSNVLNLEQSLCHVLMDKALINCILLLDKAEMEKKIKHLKEEQGRYDFSGLGTSLLRKKSAEESSTRSDGRLISVDEGVVLEGSESTNSREKLSHHLESSSLAEMEAENRALCEKNADMRRRLEDSERHNEELNVKLSELEKKLVQSGSTLPDVTINNSANKELVERLREAEIENLELVDKVQTLAENIDIFDKVEAEAAMLRSQVRDLEEKLQELKSTVDHDQQITEGVDDAPAERTNLHSKLQELETELKSKAIDAVNMEKLSTENQTLKQELQTLQKKLSGSQTTSEKDSAKIRCAQLEERILHLESRQNAELKRKEDEIIHLRSKLQTVEQRNSLFISKATAFEIKLKEIGQLISRHKDNERILQLKVDRLEYENSSLKGNNSVVEEEPKVNQNVERSEESTAEDDQQVLRETIVQLETEILLKDQEILCLKNEAVDLMSEVGKLDTEYNELAHQKVNYEKELKESRSRKEEAETELQNVLKECSKLRTDVLALMDENNGLREKIQSTSNVLKTSVSAVLSERNVLEKDLQTVQGREIELETMLSDFESKNNKLQKDVEKREATVGQLQHDLDELLTEKSKLNFSLSEIKDSQVNTAEENEALQQDMKTLEKNLCTLQESLTFCLNEKVAIVEDLSIKAAELETLRTYCSLCSEETRSMQLQIGLYKDTEMLLNNRVKDLEVSLEEWRKESLRMKEELGSIEDDRKGLDKRIHEASRAIDRVKEELISLMHIILGLQKDLLCLVDGIVACLGLEVNPLDLSRQRLVSNDSGYISNATEASSERSSGGSEANYAESLATCVLVPDEHCFVNPSEVSIIRESKSEIFRLHEELKIKLFIIKDFLEQFKENEGLKIKRDSADLLNEPESEAEISKDTCGDNLKEFPYLNKSERVKLTNLLSVLRRDCTNGDGERVYDLYSRLEEKLSGLSSQLATKEMDICELLKEKINLQNELTKSKYGITLCEHCSSDPEKVNQSNELLRANLLTYMEDTARLESEIMDFAQYKAKLEEELSEVRMQITAIEDEIITTSEPRSITSAKANESPRESADSSNASSADSADSANEKKTKRVTFDMMVAEPKETDPSFRKRKPREKTSSTKSQAQPQKPSDSASTPATLKDINEPVTRESSDIDDFDLCALLESIPMDVPKVPTKEDKEIAEIANRLSGYDNMSFNDKVDFVVHRQNSEECPTESENSPKPQRIPDNVRNSFDGSNCKMCGLLSKRRSRSSDDVYTLNKT
ncbi:hypothetical protein QZH41_019496, partial [Actinostola sp. cb2023]